MVGRLPRRTLTRSNQRSLLARHQTCSVAEEARIRGKVAQRKPCQINEHSGHAALLSMTDRRPVAEALGGWAPLRADVTTVRDDSERTCKEPKTRTLVVNLGSR